MDNNKQGKTFKESEVVVILEDIKGKFDLLAEGQKTIRDEMRRGFKEVREDMNAEVSVLRGEMKVGLNDLKLEMKTGFKEMNSRFKQVLEYLSRVEDELMEIKTELKRQKENTPDKEGYDKLEKRVSVLEKQLAEYKGLAMKKKFA